MHVKLIYYVGLRGMDLQLSKLHIQYLANPTKSTRQEQPDHSLPRPFIYMVRNKAHLLDQFQRLTDRCYWQNSQTLVREN